jgi:hypothetical protein
MGRILIDQVTGQKYKVIGGTELRPVLIRYKKLSNSKSNRLRDITDYLEGKYGGNINKLTRHKQNVMPRKWMCYVYTKLLGFSDRTVAALFGIDRCTVLYHRNDIEVKIDIYQEYREILKIIKQLIESDE